MEAENEVGQHIHCYVAALAAHTAFLEQPKSFRPSQWIKEHSERQSLNRNSLRRQNLTRDCHSRPVKHSGWAVHQPCPRQYNYWEFHVRLVGFSWFVHMCVDVCVWTMKMLSLYSQLLTNHIVLSACLDTILKTRFTCCVSRNALLLTFTFFVKFSDSFWKHINTVTVFGVWGCL